MSIISAAKAVVHAVISEHDHGLLKRKRLAFRPSGILSSAAAASSTGTLITVVCNVLQSRSGESFLAGVVLQFVVLGLRLLVVTGLLSSLLLLSNWREVLESTSLSVASIDCSASPISTPPTTCVGAFTFECALTDCSAAAPSSSAADPDERLRIYSATATALSDRVA